MRTLSKKSIPKDYFNFSKHENNDIDNESKSRNRLKLLNNLKLITKYMKFKVIQEILNKKSLPKYPDKLNNFYNE